MSSYSRQKEMEVDNRMSQEILVTIDEAAHRLNVSRSFLYPLVMRGQIASLKLGRARRVSVRELEAYVHRLQEEQANEPAE